MHLEHDLLRKEVDYLKRVTVNLERRGVCLVYNDVNPCGRLNGSVAYIIDQL